MDVGEVKEQIDEKLNEHLVKHAQKNINTRGKPGVLDRIQEKIVSRKLLVFASATALFVWYGLDPDTWGMIAMCYIGGQSAIDFAKVWKGM
tara:strand:+ start:2767 stop:3039 length:273 start_codon:yes stop_codon:yes gene_type:complete